LEQTIETGILDDLSGFYIDIDFDLNEPVKRSWKNSCKSQAISRKQYTSSPAKGGHALLHTISLHFKSVHSALIMRLGCAHAGDRAL
jgi:hypothetical protein